VWGGGGSLRPQREAENEIQSDGVPKGKAEFRKMQDKPEDTEVTKSRMAG
jgi:hypothetical protein